MDFYALLKLMVDKGASDLFITEGMPPSIKVNGKVIPVGKAKLSGDMSLELVESIMNDKQRVEYGETKELNFAIESDAVKGARFRVSAFYQRNH
ncbi:type IV pili twitching motility protein PilT, partial [Gammaproteobacteria bacterium 54_18_T64]